MAYKGRYTPKFPEKYVGDVNKIIYRSSWERKFMEWCDFNGAVKAWNSEDIKIPYISPVDGKTHRYHVDFWIKMINKKGEEEQVLIEIKPHAQRFPPKKGNKRQGRYIAECKTYAVNQAKWKAASKAAANNSMRFVVMDEFDLGLKQRRD